MYPPFENSTTLIAILYLLPYWHNYIHTQCRGTMVMNYSSAFVWASKYKIWLGFIYTKKKTSNRLNVFNTHKGKVLFSSCSHVLIKGHKIMIFFWFKKGVKTLSFCAHKVAIWLLFNADFRVREREREEKGTTNSTTKYLRKKSLPLNGLEPGTLTMKDEHDSHYTTNTNN